MPKLLKSSIFAVTSFGVCLVAEILDSFIPFSMEQRVSVETISNTVMLIIAIISFTAIVLHKKRDTTETTIRFLGNFAVSGFAFCMNIAVFRHPIRMQHFFADLRGWHLGWTIYVVIQILFLSGLAKFILIQIKRGLEWNRGIASIIIVGFLLWVVYLVYYVCSSSKKADFLPQNILLQSYLFWVVWCAIGFLFYMICPVYIKSKEGLMKIDSKKALVCTASVLAVIISYIVFTLVFGKLETLLIYVLALFVVIRTIKKKGTGTDDVQTKGTQSVYSKDIAIIVLFLVVIPILFLFVAASLESGRIEISISNLSSAAADCKSFILRFLKWE